MASRGGGGRPAPGDTILSCETITPALICGEDLVFFILFSFQPHLDQKPSISRRRPFFFLHLFWTILVFTYFWTKKRRHHEILPRVPLSLATPLFKGTGTTQLKCTMIKMWQKSLLFLQFLSAFFA